MSGGIGDAVRVLDHQAGESADPVPMPEYRQAMQAV